MLVFCRSKRRCESCAKWLAQKTFLGEQAAAERPAKLRALRESRLPRQLKSGLTEPVRCGVAFHHAGLGEEARRPRWLEPGRYQGLAWLWRLDRVARGCA